MIFGTLQTMSTDHGGYAPQERNSDFWSVLVTKLFQLKYKVPVNLTMFLGNFKSRVGVGPPILANSRRLNACLLAVVRRVRR